MSSARYCLAITVSCSHQRNCYLRSFLQIDKNGQCYLSKQESVNFGLLGNFFVSEGREGAVIKVVARRRLGANPGGNLITSMRAALASRYQPSPVSLGGVFLIKNGTAKLHIMPDFSTDPLRTDDDVNGWLRFYDMRAPLVCLSVFHSTDPGLDLRVEHTQ